MQQELETLDAVSVRIRRLRKVIGISQKKLAKLCGMSQSTVARLESDIRSLNPSYETVF
ncbi:MAG: helix-turn-helix domain-containing protein, partial [Candidatus Marsarchaeota archaeon]|nr:helix-turn-helix domain-containing protein [Candidatus Marsarchaeota archaeon]